MSNKRRRRAKARRAFTRRIVEYYQSYTLNGDSKIAAYLRSMIRVAKNHQCHSNLNQDVAVAVDKELERRRGWF